MKPEILDREAAGPERAALFSLINAHGHIHGDPRGKPYRVNASFVATDSDGQWIGVGSGWAPEHDGRTGRWFYLDELFVEKPLRGRRIGSDLLHRVEQRALSYGMDYIWTWTAGYEAPEFYQHQGYSIFMDLDDYYTSGHGRIGLYKKLAEETRPTDRGVDCVITERPITDHESDQMNSGFAAHGLEFGNPDLPSERVSCIAKADDQLIGIATGLLPKKADGVCPWFSMGEFIVAEPYRGQGLGGQLMRRLESRLLELGADRAWLWVADYEAGYFESHGYEQFFRMPGYHISGATRLGLSKQLA